jgi:hypothetical protein
MTSIGNNNKQTNKQQKKKKIKKKKIKKELKHISVYLSTE